MPEDQSQKIRAIMLESARAQVAALSAGIAFWSGWVEAAGQFVRSASQELTVVGQSQVDTDAMIGRLTDSSREYLRRMTELPAAAVAQFNAELKTGGRAPKRKKGARVARAKP